MTLADVIHACLSELRRSYYAGRPQRDWHRDVTPLTKALARYGHVCHSRGWRLRPADIRQDIGRVLKGLKFDATRGTYLPIYLEAAIDRHCRLRAEELSAKSRATSNVVGRVLSELHPAAAPEPNAVELMAGLYADLRRRQTRRPSGGKQMGLWG